MFRLRELVDRNRRNLADLLTREHGKTVPDALGEVSRGLENIEFACGIANLLKGGFSEQVSRNVDVFVKSANRLVSLWALRRSISQPWSRCGCWRTPSLAAMHLS